MIFPTEDILVKIIWLTKLIATQTQGPALELIQRHSNHRMLPIMVMLSSNYY